MDPYKLRLLLLLMFLGALPNVAQAETGSSSRQRPNVLLIAIDDLRTSLGCYGDPLVQSPHLDRFARSARLFTRAYAQQAVCGPSRTSLLTGRLPDHTGVWHNRNRFRQSFPDLVTLPQLFKQNGYRALSFGKVFSGNEKELDPPSWSAPEVLRQAGWKNYVLAENQGGGKQVAYESADVEDDAYPDGRLASLAISTLEQLHQQQQPFFLAVGFFKPHLPFNAPQRYWDRYDPAAFALPRQNQQVQGAPAQAAHSHRELGGYRHIPKDEQLDDDQVRRLRHGYYACVSYVDAQVGRLLDAMERLQLHRNTIVVIWGDHGFALGEMNRWCKGTNFERDTRVPLMIRTPDMAVPGMATDSLVELVDLYPTISQLAGLTPPADLDGHSLVAMLRDPQATGRDVALSQFNRPWQPSAPQYMGYSIRSTTHRYTRWIDWTARRTVAEELYDYTSPASTTKQAAALIEHCNLIHQPEQAATLAELRQKLDQQLTVRIGRNGNAPAGR